MNATFGTVEYREGGIVALPVTFAAHVIAPSKTIFGISYVSGDPLQGIDYRLIGKDTAYALVFEVPPDRSGRFQITANGEVLSATGSYENVTASALDVDYNTSIPRLKDYDIPEDYTAGEIFDVILQFDTDATVSPAPTGGTFLDHFIFEGADLGTPNLYRKTDDVYPTLPIAETLPAEWTQADLTTEEATLYLLRWDPVEGDPQGIFNLTVREGAFRGPVS